MKGDWFKDKVVAVTGSARGIGKNIARAFAQEGALVILCDIDRQGGLATLSEFHGQELKAGFLAVDLSQGGAAQTMIQEIIQRWNRLDILVNNARSGERKTLLEETESNWDEGLAVTLKAAFFASQEALRVMSHTGGGGIVNISSIAAFLSCHESPSYHVAKAGLVQMTRYLAAHAGAYGVRVNAVLPGFIVQDEHKVRYGGKDNQDYREIAESCHPLGKVGSSDDVAKAVLFLCSPEAAFISGQCLIVDGGLTLQEQSGLVNRLDNKRKWSTGV